VTHNKRMQRTRVMDKFVLRSGHRRVADARRYTATRRTSFYRSSFKSSQRHAAPLALCIWSRECFVVSIAGLARVLQSSGSALCRSVVSAGRGVGSR